MVVWKKAKKGDQRAKEGGGTDQVGKIMATHTGKKEEIEKEQRSSQEPG